MPDRWRLAPASKLVSRMPAPLTVVLGPEHWLVRPRLQDPNSGDLHCELCEETAEGWTMVGVIDVPPSFSERTVKQRVRAYLAVT